jgi:ABC-2 type transport system ATP-binding protein
VTAVDDLFLTADHGGVLGILGPNGAGKTSTVETMEGYREPSGGSVRVLGLDPRGEARALAPRIGVMLQRGGIYPAMTPVQAIRLFASYYSKPESPSELMDLVGLRQVADTPWRRLSGGEQQRLSLALALVGRPEVVFLDEPTAGVDPEGRIQIRAVVSSLRERGVCVILTTHELSEAQRMADEIVILVGGRSVERGSPEEIVRRAAPSGFQFTSDPGIDVAEIARAAQIGRDRVREGRAGEYELDAEPSPRRLAALTAWLADNDLAMSDLQTGPRDLESAYLAVMEHARTVDGASSFPGEPVSAGEPGSAGGPVSRREPQT